MGAAPKTIVKVYINDESMHAAWFSTVGARNKA